jgi:hypothetical protein
MATRIEEIFLSAQLLRNMKARVAIFNLNGGASIWWEDLKNVKGINERS